MNFKKLIFFLIIIFLISQIKITYSYENNSRIVDIQNTKKVLILADSLYVYKENPVGYAIVGNFSESPEIFGWEKIPTSNIVKAGDLLDYIDEYYSGNLKSYFPYCTKSYKIKDKNGNIGWIIGEWKSPKNDFYNYAILAKIVDDNNIPSFSKISFYDITGFYEGYIKDKNNNKYILTAFCSKISTLLFTGNGESDFRGKREKIILGGSLIFNEIYCLINFSDELLLYFSGNIDANNKIISGDVYITDRNAHYSYLGEFFLKHKIINFNNRIEVFGSTLVEIKEKPGIYEETIGEKYWGATGIIIDGPVYLDNKNWYRILWNNDENVNDVIYKPFIGWIDGNFIWKYDFNDRIRGLDISRFNTKNNDPSTIDWKKIKNSGRQFIYIKASEGNGFKFGSFLEDSIAIVTKLKLNFLIGVYHLARPIDNSYDIPNINDAEDEANKFYEISKEYLKPGFLLPALDVEDLEGIYHYDDDNYWSNLALWIHKWMETIKEKIDYYPILYCSKNYAENLLRCNSEITKYKLWIADYTNNLKPDINGWNDWIIRQYAGDKININAGHIPGFEVNIGVDLDIFNGDINELINKLMIKENKKEIIKIPILLVHGFQISPFEPFEIWEKFAKILSGNNLDKSEAKRQLTDHYFYYLPAIDNNHYNVYISNYTKNTHLPTLLNISEYAKNLKEEIDEVKKIEGVDKINIIAHSMGGLVARRYIESIDFSDNYYDSDVENLIMLGTPNKGVLSSVFKKLILSNPVFDYTVYKCLDEMFFGSQFLLTLNSGSTSEDLNVKYWTFSGVFEIKCNLLKNEKLCKLAKSNIYTDGLVWPMSVELDDAKMNYQVLYADHSGLINSDEVLSKISEILENKELNSSEKIIKTNNPVYSGIINGSSIYPETFIIQFLSPVDVTIIDQYGRKIDNKGLNEIQDAEVLVIDNKKIFSLPLDLNYSLLINATSSGNLTIQISSINKDGEVFGSVFENIKIEYNTNISSSLFNSNNLNLKLNIDYNGDNNADYEIEPDIIGEIEKNIKKIILKLQIGNTIMYINDNPVIIDISPQIIEGRTMLPIRHVVEPLGANVVWDGDEKKVTINFKEIKIELWIGKNLAKVNGNYKLIDPDNPKVVPLIINGRTMLPIRFVAENLGCKVEWDPFYQSITITYPNI